MSQDEHDQIEKRHWLMRVKLRVPRQQIALIERTRLTEVLDDTLDHGFALVMAPAGFGKTTLLVQWRELLLESNVKVAWITLDEGDADPHQFIAYMIFALAEAGLDMGALEMIAEQGVMDTSPRLVLATIMEHIGREKEDVVLILDDYHRLDCEDVDMLMEDLISGGPKNFTLVINSRVRPVFNITHYIAMGQAIEIDAENLRFSRQETKEAVADEINDDVLDALFERTEGWAVAVQLARLLAPHKTATKQQVMQFSGKTGHIANYLTDQVVEQLDTDVQDFLIKTSILERFNAPLADALRSSNDSWRILKKLEPLHALLVPLEDASDWYRYHHLFADCLQDLLRRNFSDEEINNLHTKASKWLESEGYVSEAVRHARLAGDYERCANLIAEAGGWELILFGGIGYLRNLLRNIPEKELQNFPRIQVARSYLALKDGQIKLARAYFDSADFNPLTANGEVVDTPGIGRDLLNIRTLLDTYEDKLSPVNMTEAFEADIARASKDDGITQGVIHCATVMHSLATGKFDLAEGKCRDAMRSMRMVNTVLGLNYAYLHAGLIAFYQAKFQLAEANFWEAQRMAEDNFGADSGLKSLANILLSALSFWRGGFSDDETIGRFMKSFDYVEKYDGWLDIYATALDVQAFGLIGLSESQSWEDMLLRYSDIADERGIERLSYLVDGHRLLAYRDKTNNEEANILARKLSEKFEIGCWRENRFAWRSYQVVAQALAYYYSDFKRPKAIEIASDLIECCEGIGARFHKIQALILRAIIVDKTGDRSMALEDLMAALEIAAPEKIHQPFLIYRSTGPLMRAAIKLGRQNAVDTLTQNFIAECIELSKANIQSGVVENVDCFSPREQEVMEELAQNISNKEIARALDMTEHTVKFHLKNIYKKLGVEKRAKAIEVARSRNIII